MQTIREPARDVPVAESVDVLVLGGGCTGVFAAVAAAREGARTAIVERHGFFGGAATAGLVTNWHSLKDIHGEHTIIAGLTATVLERMAERHAVHEAPEHFVLNTEELKIELDGLVVEHKVRPFLDAFCCAAILEDERPVAAVIEDKSGRRAIRARFFIDCTGDGDFLRAAGLPLETRDELQPPTACARFSGLKALAHENKGFSLYDSLVNPETPGHLPAGFIWSASWPGLPDDTMVAGTRVNGADCSDADQLTSAEIEGRRQVRRIHDLIRNHVRGGDKVALSAVCASIGIRETRHAVCLHRLTQGELLWGERFPDAIANGTYRVDIHHSDKPGITFRNLDGTEQYGVPGQPWVEGRWRPEGEPPTEFYQIPHRSLVPRGARNVLAAGRLTDADEGAYGAIRVMVNCNQTGEAAGTACALALHSGCDVADVDVKLLRRTLSEHGAAIL
jgi:hypothetical protein